MELRKHLLFCGLILAACGGDRGGIATLPATPSRGTAADGGPVSASEAGDVKVGNGALEIIRLRMDRQTPAGVSVFRQYAQPGQTYRMQPGETIELWAEWDTNLNKVPTIIPENPRFTVDWGQGEPDSPDFTGCGSCLLKHPYPNRGLYRVVASLNDKNGTVVSRTFFLDSTESPLPSPTPTPSVSPTPTPTVTLTIACTGANCDPTNHVGTYYDGSGLITGSGFSCGNFGAPTITGRTSLLPSILPHDVCGPISFPVGTVVTLTATGDTACDRVPSWRGACAGTGTGSYASTTGTCVLTLTADTVASVDFYDDCAAARR